MFSVLLEIGMNMTEGVYKPISIRKSPFRTSHAGTTPNNSMYTIVRKQLASQSQDAFCFVRISHVKKMRYKLIWEFPKIGVFPPKWMVKIMENTIKMDDLGIPLFLETPIEVPRSSFSGTSHPLPQEPQLSSAGKPGSVDGWCN